MGKRRGVLAGHQKAKLNDAQVLELIAIFKKRGYSARILRELAPKYGVGPGCLFDIAIGITHVKLMRALRGPMKQISIGKRASSWRVLGPDEK